MGCHHSSMSWFQRRFCSLATRSLPQKFCNINFKLILQIDIKSVSQETALKRMPRDYTDNKPTFGLVGPGNGVVCCQATSNCLCQCWPRSLSPYSVSRPRWVIEAAFEVRVGMSYYNPLLYMDVISYGWPSSDNLIGSADFFYWNKPRCPRSRSPISESGFVKMMKAGNLLIIFVKYATSMSQHHPFWWKKCNRQKPVSVVSQSNILSRINYGFGAIRSLFGVINLRCE